jgi:hypothetical protein
MLLDKMSPHNVITNRLRELEGKPWLTFTMIVEMMKKELHAEWAAIHPLEEENSSESFLNQMMRWQCQNTNENTGSAMY